MQAITMSATGWLAGRFGRKALYLLSDWFCYMLCALRMPPLKSNTYRGAGYVFCTCGANKPSPYAGFIPESATHRRCLFGGLGVMFAPVMGPVIGGWLTDEYSWRWVFYVSMPFSLLGILGAVFFIRETPKNLERRFDIFGFIALAIALAATQFMLDRGEGEGWFGSDLIVATAVIIGCPLPFRCSLATKSHSLPLRLRPIAIMMGLFFMFVRYFGAFHERDYALFLQNARGYPILTAALVMMPRGLGSLFRLILAGKLSGRMDTLQIAIGFASTAYSAWLFSTFTTDVGIWMFVFAAFFNGIGIGSFLCRLPQFRFGH